VKFLEKDEKIEKPTAPNIRIFPTLSDETRGG
jgi:hypothetical protein